MFCPPSLFSFPIDFPAILEGGGFLDPPAHRLDASTPPFLGLEGHVVEWSAPRPWVDLPAGLEHLSLVGVETPALFNALCIVTGLSYPLQHTSKLVNVLVGLVILDISVAFDVMEFYSLLDLRIVFTCKVSLHSA